MNYTMVAILCLLRRPVSVFGHLVDHTALAPWAGLRAKPAALFPLFIEYIYSASGIRPRLPSRKPRDSAIMSQIYPKTCENPNRWMEQCTVLP